MTILVAVTALTTCFGGQEFRRIITAVDSSGGTSTNTVNLGGINYTNLTAVGQPGGGATATNSTQVNHAGFLQAADIKHPGLDSDGDGVPDEVEADNDADGLEDADELDGVAFDPATATGINTADTDGDGALDGEEALAGTDPTNAAVSLRITSIRIVNNTDIAVAWIARSNTTYHLWGDTNLADGFPLAAIIGTNVLAAGPAAAPWYVMTNVFVSTNALATNINYYRVEVAP